MRLEEVEEADGETETEKGEEIFSQIKLDIEKMPAGDGSEVFADEEVEEEQEYIEVYVSSDEDEEEEVDSD